MKYYEYYLLQLFIRVLTNIDLSSEQTDVKKNQFNISEVELIYYLLKKRNLSINLTNYKENQSINDYTLKTSLRYSYDY